MAQTKPTATAETMAGPSMVEAMMQMQRASIEPMHWFGTAWLSLTSDLGAELAEFVAARIKEDIRTQHQLLHCKDAAEAQVIQAQFLETAFEQYTAETGKMAEMSQTILARLADTQKA